MGTNHPLRAIGLGLALASSSAIGHGDAHDSHASAKSFDPAKVEQTSFGRAGDPKRVDRIIKTTMSDAMRFSPSKLQAKRGETVKFAVSNQGKVIHEMVLGTAEDLKKHAELMRKFPGMEHENANIAHVKPGKTGEIVWQFTHAGEYAFACLVPGHFEAGMVGTVVVK